MNADSTTGGTYYGSTTSQPLEGTVPQAIIFSITQLTLHNNPCARKPLYKQAALGKFPNLNVLDGAVLTEDELLQYLIFLSLGFDLTVLDGATLAEDELLKYLIFRFLEFEICCDQA